MTKHLQIYHYFIDIIGADKVAKAKPYPDMLNYLIKKHNLKKDQTILVGDSHKDIIAANSANIDSLLVNWGFTKHDEKSIQNIKELEEYILQWNNK